MREMSLCILNDEAELSYYDSFINFVVRRDLYRIGKTTRFILTRRRTADALRREGKI